ncbi:hypothetical protein N0K71_05105 [Dellaglioa algida]|uniref:Uncharacterized protein n=1 Tax=Dellaglioa algida DSM 15638 TaxID=1423719 RepID=A0A0R1HGD4_9LACO|nr:hypothetical protein [Dellaglioa algida]KRK45468.1 hypothetical protein FC66_GL001431 [Dellaglioa algida DSM 15638]MDK1732999.1 hypothetical protein [Dellaglioa algida]MDK1734553.1 hypothetical protein [Dellaglioa algida]
MGRKGWIILLTFITVSVIGGNLYKVHEKKVEEKNEIVQVKVEHSFVVELKKNVAGIKSIKFKQALYNSWINQYMMTIMLTYEKEPGSNEVNFDYYDKDKMKEISGLEGTGVNKGVTKGKVEVTYTNGKKTSI